MSHSFPSSSDKGESDKGEPLSFGRNGWRTSRGMRLRGLPFSGDFLSCSKQTSVRWPVGKQPRSTSPWGQMVKRLLLVLHISFQATDSTCRKNAERLTSYSWNGPIVPHSVFFFTLKGEEEKNKSNLLSARMATLQRAVSKWVFKLWCFLNPSLQSCPVLAHLTVNHVALKAPNC